MLRRVLLCLLGILVWVTVRGAVRLHCQDGQRYPVPGGPVVHTLTKTLASALVYQGLGLFHVKHPTRDAVLAIGGVFAVAKGLELAKGHRLGPVDTVHDLLAHGLLVVPLASRKGWPALGIGFLMVGTCRWSSPRWC